MKKFLCLLVAAALIISFSACSETPEYENNSSASEEILTRKNTVIPKQMQKTL